jgi:hypothetical protein
MVVLLAQGVKCLKADWLVECAAAGHMLDTTRFEITPKIKFNKDTGVRCHCSVLTGCVYALFLGAQLDNVFALFAIMW